MTVLCGECQQHRGDDEWVDDGGSPLWGTYSRYQQYGVLLNGAALEMCVRASRVALWWQCAGISALILAVSQSTVWVMAHVALAAVLSIVFDVVWVWCFLQAYRRRRRAAVLWRDVEALTSTKLYPSMDRTVRELSPVDAWINDSKAGPAD